MAEALVRSPASRQADAFRTRKSSHEQRPQRNESSREQQLSRLVAGALGLTAQNNPNWRTRPGSDSPQSSGESHRETRRIRGDRTSSGHSIGKGRSSNALENRHAVLQDAKPGAAASSSISRGSKGMLDSSQHGGLYHIYKHIDLGQSGFVNGPLSLIELGFPFDASSPSLAKVERLRKDLRTRSKGSGSSKRERIKVALHEAHPTPLEGHCVSQSNPFSQTSPSSSTHPDTPSVSNQNPADHDSAFQKMLQKLSRSTEQTEKDHGRVEPQRHEKNDATQARHPVPFSGRRANTLSEPCEPWTNAKLQTHQKEETTDSGVCVEENVRSKTLNPKAREFLTKADLMSLKNKEHFSESSSSADEQPRSPTVRDSGPISEKTSGPQKPSPNARCMASSETTEARSSQHAGPESSTKPLGDVPAKPLIPTAPPALAYGVSPYLLNHLFSGGSLLSLGSDQLSGQCLAPSPALATLPALAAQSVLQPVAGNILSFPPIPPTPLMNTVFPAMAASPVDPYAMRPGCPVSVVGPLAARPSPVPKPRRPDPGDQQAYEAWIEWRKANEPGYAMECKLRQQRRAQRKLTGQSKAKSAKGTDTSCSA